MRSFSFSHVPLELDELRSLLADPVSGAYAQFEGWVRNHNEGQPVLRLDYQAYEALGVKEGERIIAEACERWPVRQVYCVHRLGELSIGDIAVWVGASAAHRDAAFAACRYVIDEVKDRVPIWKKEHYADGASGWINCQKAPGDATLQPPSSSRA
ncbi:MAG: molybdenum cofactor biosynthesis protein MoaE [Chromatiales bacterium]|nr:molybdenum cofactor biosynthesis protein MoaE [Chromatiales bacterium]